MYAREADDLIPLLGRMVRVRNGKHTFIGTLNGPSTKKFFRGVNRTAYGLVVEGKDFKLEFAWWDWFVEPFQMAAAE
jgi:hypothetical protein